MLLTLLKIGASLVLGVPLLALTLFGIVNRIWDWWMFTGRIDRSTTWATHRKKVKKVQEQVRAWNRAGRNVKMCTARPTWKSFAIHKVDKGGFHKINVDMGKMVELNLKQKFVVVEPSMRIGQLTRILNPLGWTVPVVPELETLTIGGLVAGAGCETSSHNYGIFQNTCISYEVVMPNGEVVTCSRDSNSDIFHAMNHSYGTIGFLTAVKIELIPSTPYVKLDYYCANSPEAVMKLMETRHQHEFCEGIVLAPDKYVVMLGDFAQRVEGPLNPMNGWNQPFFYQQVETIFEHSKSLNEVTKTEYIPLREYYHRHTRGAFWLIKYAAKFLAEQYFISIFGWAYPVNVDLLQLVMPKGFREYHTSTQVLQDISVPWEGGAVFLNILNKQTQVYPLWICPIKLVERTPLLASQQTRPTFEIFNVGIYGMPGEDREGQMSSKEIVLSLVNYVTELGGVQGMYGDSYATKEEYHKMYYTQEYEKVREKWECDKAFPHVYDKIGPAAKGLI